MVLADGRFVTASERRAPGPVLGAPRRRRQLRRRHLVPVPARTRSTRSTAARCSGRSRSRARSCAGTATSSPTRPRRLRLLRVPDGAAGAAVPGGTPRPEDVRRSSGAAPAPPDEADEGVRAGPRAVGAPAFDGVRPDAVPGAAEHVRRASTRRACSGTGRRDFVNELTDEAIALHVEHASRLPTMLSHDAPVPDQRRRPAASHADETALSYRDATWSQVIVGVDPDPAERATDRDVGDGLLGGAAPVFSRAAPTSTS